MKEIKRKKERKKEQRKKDKKERKNKGKRNVFFSALGRKIQYGPLDRAENPIRKINARSLLSKYIPPCKIVTFLQLAAGGNGKFGPRKIFFRPVEKNLHVQGVTDLLRSERAIISR